MLNLRLFAVLFAASLGVSACAPVRSGLQDSSVKRGLSTSNIEACVPYRWSNDTDGGELTDVHNDSGPYLSGPNGPILTPANSESFSWSLDGFLFDHHKNYFENYYEKNGDSLSMAAYLYFSDKDPDRFKVLRRTPQGTTEPSDKPGNYLISKTLNVAMESQNTKPKVFAWCLRPWGTTPWYHEGTPEWKEYTRRIGDEEVKYDSELAKYRAQIEEEIESDSEEVKHRASIRRLFDEYGLTNFYTSRGWNDIDEDKWPDRQGFFEIYRAIAGKDKISLLYEDKRSEQTRCAAVALTSVGPVGGTDGSRAIWLYLIMSRSRGGAGAALAKCLLTRFGRKRQQGDLPVHFVDLKHFNDSCGMAYTAEEHLPVQRFWARIAKWQMELSGFAYQGLPLLGKQAVALNYEGEVPYYIGGGRKISGCGAAHNGSTCRDYVGNFLGVTGDSPPRLIVPREENEVVHNVFAEQLQQVSATRKDMEQSWEDISFRAWKPLTLEQAIQQSEFRQTEPPGAIENLARNGSAYSVDDNGQETQPKGPRKPNRVEANTGP